MSDRLKDLKALLRELRVEQLRQARPEQRILVHNHHGVGRLAGLLVDGCQIGQCGLRNDTEARTEPESILESASDNYVGDSDIDDIWKLVARRRLRCRQANLAGVSTDDAADLGGVHFLDCRNAAVRGRLRIAKHSVNLA